MPRPRIPRRIDTPPRFLQFKPVGVPRRLLETVTMTVDEIEAIRLADREGLDHQPAAERMGISRPTFTRLIEAARSKLAMCIIDGKELVIEGGDVDYEHSLQRCRDCGDEVREATDAPREETTAANTDPQAEEACRACGSENVDDLAELALRGRFRGHNRGRGQKVRQSGQRRGEKQ
ncbi:MAG: DUF134 domain-containing protein [Bacteroidetes bacterium]|nr:DUF134 domain-containing protein [Bacteroidota bacterium]